MELRAVSLNFCYAFWQAFAFFCRNPNATGKSCILNGSYFRRVLKKYNTKQFNNYETFRV